MFWIFIASEWNSDFRQRFLRVQWVNQLNYLEWWKWLKAVPSRTARVSVSSFGLNECVRNCTAALSGRTSFFISSLLLLPQDIGSTLTSTWVNQSGIFKPAAGSLLLTSHTHTHTHPHTHTLASGIAQTGNLMEYNCLLLLWICCQLGE